MIKKISFNTEPPNSTIPDSLTYLNSIASNNHINSIEVRAGQELYKNLSSELKLLLNNKPLGSIFLDSSYFIGNSSRTSMPIYYLGDSVIYIFSSEKILPQYNPKIQSQNQNLPIYLYNKYNPSPHDQFAIYKVKIDPINNIITQISKNIINTNRDLHYYSVIFKNNLFYFVCNEFNTIKLITLNLNNEIINSDSLILFDTLINFKFNYNLKIDFEFSNDANYFLCSYEIDTINYSSQILEGLSVFSILDNKIHSHEKIIELNDKNEIINQKILPSFFSLDNQLIYIPIDYPSINSLKIFQYSILDKPIANTKIPIFEGQGIFASFKSHIYGTNGKIYLGPNIYGNFSLIKYPNRKGIECEFQENSKLNACQLPIPNYPNIKNCYMPFQPHQYHGHNLDFKIRLECDSGFTTINLSDSIHLSDFKWFIYDNQGGNNYSDSASGRNIHLKTPYPGKFFLKFSCKAPNGFIIWYSDTIDIDYSQVPQALASFDIQDQKACQFVDFKIFNTGNYPNSDSTHKWTWSFNNWDTTLNSFKDTFQFKFTDTGVFSVQLRYSNSYCSRFFESNKKIEVLSAPKPGISISSDSICNSNYLKFQNKYSSSNLKYTTWYNGLGDSLVQNQAILDSFFYPFAGKYFLKQRLFSDNGCVSIDSLPINVIKGFDENQKSRLISSSFEDNQLKISWDSIPFANRYQLWNGSQANALHKLIYSGNSFNYSFDFSEPYPIQYFRLKVLDECGNTLNSNPSNSLLLNYNFDHLGLKLTWNSYDSFYFGLKQYELYSSKDGINFQWIQSSNKLEYLDLNFFKNNSDSLAYKIIALGNDSIEIAESPILWVKAPFSLYIPNAFSPNQDPHNPYFMPVSTGILSQNYQLKIYNRWGEEVFSSANKQEAWTGNNQNNQALPEGVYFYTLKFSYLDSQNIIRKSFVKGQVTLIR